MGPLEILLIMVIAFILLGPERMLDVARLLGKGVREGRKLASEIPRVVVEDDEIKVVNTDTSRFLGGTNPSSRDGSDQSDAAEPEGPVPFSRRRKPSNVDDDDQPSQPDRES